MLKWHKITYASSQVDFTLIRIAADLAVNFYTTGWYVVFACDVY